MNALRASEPMSPFSLTCQYQVKTLYKSEAHFFPSFRFPVIPLCASAREKTRAMQSCKSCQKKEAMPSVSISVSSVLKKRSNAPKRTFPVIPFFRHSVIPSFPFAPLRLCESFPEAHFTLELLKPSAARRPRLRRLRPCGLFR